jgi:hypothetical protein
MPRRAERTSLAHDPQRDGSGEDVADHRNESDQSVDAIAHLGARHDESDVHQLRQRFKPREALLPREGAPERHAAEIRSAAAKATACSETSAQILKAEIPAAKRRTLHFVAILVDDRRTPA